MANNNNSDEGATLRLARWVAGLTYKDLPARTRDVVRLAIFDTVGCGVYGFQTPWTQALLKWAQAGGAAGARMTPLTWALLIPAGALGALAALALVASACGGDDGGGSSKLPDTITIEIGRAHV